MILGLVSDTHGHVANARAAVRMLESLGVSEVIHCGDIGGVEIVDLFGAWPTHFVFGNVDTDQRRLEIAIRAAGQTCHGEFAQLERGGKRIAAAHGHDARQLAEAIASGRYDLVCTGHTHEANAQREGTTLVVNPGALFRATPHTIAIVRLPEMEVTHVAV